MNHYLKKNQLMMLAALLITILFFTHCTHDDDKKCCKGYTGSITDSSANALVHKCHFILKDSIKVWTARFEANKHQISNDSLPGVNKVLGDSSSFNSCIVKAIICNPDCIGMRVVYGMDAARRVHVMLVGIKADYSTLYIPRPDECCGNNSKVATGVIPPSSSDRGGGEYGQMP